MASRDLQYAVLILDNYAHSQDAEVQRLTSGGSDVSVRLFEICERRGSIAAVRRLCWVVQAARRALLVKAGPSQMTPAIGTAFR